MRVLLAHGAKVNVKENWKQQTALMWAAHEGNAAAVKLLLDLGAPVNDMDKNRETPLHGPAWRDPTRPSCCS
jgi:ankyrin repeat protein